MTRRARKPHPWRPKVGDLVLYASYAATPAEWMLCRVLWVGEEDWLSQHQHGGTTYRQLLDFKGIVACGDIPQLAEFRARCQDLVGDARRRIDEAAAELGRRREAMWAKLDELRGEVFQGAPLP